MPVDCDAPPLTRGGLTRRRRPAVGGRPPRVGLCRGPAVGLRPPRRRLDGDDPETCIRREAEEETGYRIRAPRKVFEAYMSPGSVTEKLHGFVADYEPADRVCEGGGRVDEGEDIEVIEMPLDGALAAIQNGQIQDGKTVMLLQHVALEELRRRAGSGAVAAQSAAPKII